MVGGEAESGEGGGGGWLEEDESSVLSYGLTELTYDSSSQDAHDCGCESDCDWDWD